MTFFQPLLLWGLLAAFVPILIHLLNRRRHKTVPWAAMQFLLKATRESRGKKKLRHIVILTCRAAGIAALATSAARPVMSGLFGGLGGGKPDLVVILFDRSASMEANPRSGTLSKRELALGRLRDALKDMEGSRVVLIDSASGQPQEVPSPETLSSLSSVSGTDSAADMPGLMLRAVSFLSENTGRSEVWVVSDLQSSNWQAQNDLWLSAKASLASLPQPPGLRVLALTGEPAPNQSLRLLAARRAADQLLLDIEITRNDEGAAAINLPLTATINGLASTSNVTLEGSSLRLRRTLDLPPGKAPGYGWLSIPGDGNVRDNVAFFAYGPPRPVKSLLVAPPGEAADYLAAAAAPEGFGSQTVERIDPSNVAALDATGTAAIFWAAPLPQGTAAEKVSRFLSEGGQAVFFPPQREESLNEFLGVRWSAITKAAEDKFFVLESWNHDDGLLRDGLDGGQIPGARMKAVQRRLAEGQLTSMAKWDDGKVFLGRQVVDRGTAWFAGSLPDYTWSNLGDADVLLPLAQRAVTVGSERFDTGYLSEVGSKEAAARPGETRERIDSYGTPDPANLDYQAGIHRYGDRMLALNHATAEDDPAVLDRESLDQVLDGTRYTLLEDRGTSTRETTYRDLWRGFLMAMLAFLIAEAVLCLPRAPSQEPLPGAHGAKRPPFFPS